MELILRESIENLGRRGDIVRVANGYARNYLLPRKLGLPVTEANRRQVERERVIVEAREAKDRQSAQKIADQVSAVECIVARRVGETGTLYGSVTSADIVESLANLHLMIDKRKIELAEPLKELGDFVVPVRLHRDVKAELKVKVVKEELDDSSVASSSE
jgi:large subunit ribosomal protein L9